MHKKHTLPGRDGFGTRWGFILACIGSAVGMGNIWMFPRRVAAYGGGTFLVPYLLFVFLIASSGVIGEMAFGRAARSGPIGAFEQAVTRRGLNRRVGTALGLIPVVGSLALAIGYTVVVSWIFKYAIGSITGAALSPADLDGFVAAFDQTAPGASSLTESVRIMLSGAGNTGWLAIGLIVTFVILFMGVGSGIERANKAMMPLFFLLFVGLGVYVALQPGADAGYRYIFSVNPAGWLDPMTWIYAMGQAFFSLSVAGNGTLIYGSYLRDSEDIPASARNVAIFDTLAALLAALVIIPAMATAGATLDQSGPGLMFIFLPNLFRGMPGGRIFSIVFFVAVLFAGLTSLLNLYEAPIATLQEKFSCSRRRACLIIGLVGGLVAVCIQGIVSGWMDAVSIYVCPLGAALAGILFFWVCGRDYIYEQIGKGREKPVPRWIYPLSKYVYCLLALLVLLAGALTPGGIG